MKKILFWASTFLCAFTLTLSAKQISQTQSLNVTAELFSSIQNLRSESHFQLIYTAYDKSSDLRAGETALYYIYNVDDQGFVIVSADDCLYPIIGYSLNGKYDPENCAPEFLTWMKDVESGISEAIQNKKEASERTINAWNAFLSGNSESLRSSQAIPALTKSEWGQSTPYNNKCPVYGTDTTVVGCVATAMAQIMYFWKYPSSGTGRSLSYRTATYRILIPSVNYASSKYLWDTMPPTYGLLSTTEAKNAVATLMYHCGVSVKMDYTSDGSGAYTRDVGPALMNVFGYDEGVNYKYKGYYSYSEWKNILAKEISEGRPVLYGGQSDKEGHAFVCDGYDNYGMFHFNWGWNGINNGYFDIEENFEYKDENELIIGIQPDAGNPPAFEMVIGPNTDIYPNGNIESDTTGIIQGEAFTARAAFWNIGYGMFSGYLGFVIIDSNNNIVEAVSPEIDDNWIELDEYYGLTEKAVFDCNISTSVPDGIYRLKAAVKPDGGRWQTINAENGYVGEITLKVGRSLNAISTINKDHDIHIYVENGNLTLETPYNEEVYIYNSIGTKIKQFKKDAGRETISIPPVANDIIIVKGSSGWVKKTVLN